MRRPLLALAALAVALPGVPALASTDVHGACANPQDLPVLLLGGDGLSGTIATPSSLVGNETESASVLLSLEGQPVARTATVSATITWSVPANDYDLSLSSRTASSTTEDYQPFDPPVETTSIGATRHCDTVVVSAVDYLAPVVVDTIEYAVSAD